MRRQQIANISIAPLHRAGLGLPTPRPHIVRASVEIAFVERVFHRVNERIVFGLSRLLSVRGGSVCGCLKQRPSAFLGRQDFPVFPKKTCKWTKVVPAVPILPAQWQDATSLPDHFRGNRQMKNSIRPSTQNSRLDSAMALLDSRSRHVMELWLEGDSLAEIADAVGLPERAVAVIRASSIWRLRDALALQPSPDGPEMPEIHPK
jgi:DNA-binding CsgD family transcriptional regulator